MKPSTPSRLAKLAIFIPLPTGAVWLAAKTAGAVRAASADFMPHGYCYMWDPGIVWLHVASDGLIALAYFAIPVILVYFIRKHRELFLHGIFWMFAAFILACGATHLMEIWNVWHGDYMLAGMIKAVTAAVSVVTAAMLVPLVPKVMSLPERIHLVEINRALEAEIAEHKRFDRPIDATLRRWVSAGFAGAMVVIGCLGILSWRNVQKAAEEAAWVAHTHEVSTTLEITLRHLVDVETGGRGFALSGDNLFLAPYESGQRAVGQDLQALRDLVVDPAQMRRLEILAGQASERIEASRDLVALRQRTGALPTEAGLLRGKQLMDTARATIAEMEAAEESLLEERSQRARAAQHSIGWVIGLGSVLGVLFLSIAGFTASHEIGVSAKARAEVDALNANLERRVAERTAAFVESEGRLAGVIQSAMDAILTVDEAQSILMFNGAAERMFRCTAAEALGQPITRFIPQRFHSAHAGHIQKFGDTGVTSRAMGSKNALWAARADGQEFQIEASISQVVTGGKKLFTVILRDVTERVQAEQSLREAQARMTGIIASAMDAIITTDDEQRILVFNAAAEKVLRCPAAEALGQPITRFIPQRFHGAHGGHMKEFAEKEVTARAMGALGALWGVRADGEEFRIEASISHISAGGRNLFTVILRDITERVRAEAQREHLAAVVDSSDDAIISKDLRGIINAWNRGAEKIFGYTTVEAVGQPMLMLFPPERRSEEAGILGRIGRGESVEHFETARVRKGGDKIDVSVTISPVRDGQGTVIGASTIARDITERKRAQEALREQAQVMDSAQVFVRDMQSRVVYWPKGAEKLYGFTREEAVGILSHDLFHTKFPEPLEMVERKLFETGMWEGELIHTRKDGRVIVVSSAWVLHRDSQGQPIRILETNIDITARRQAEEELYDSQEKLRLAVDGARLGIWNWDLKTGELEGSPLAFALFGLPADVKFDFETFLATLHADDRAMVEEAMQRTLGQRAIYEVEYRCTWPDGSERWIAAKGRAYLNDGGQTERVGGIVFDVTERRRALEGLRESEDRFRLFVEHAPAALAMFDREMRYLHWSRRWQADYGLDERELRGVSHYELFPEIPERWKEIHRRALAGEVQRGEDDRFDRIDGSVQWIRWEARPWYDRTGAIAGIVIFAEEITARKLAEKALQESETNFRMVVNLVPQFAWICTNEGLNTYFNERWYKYTGLTPEQSLGTGWSTPFHPDDKPKAWAAWNHATATGETYSVESRLQAADGSYRWFLMRGEPLLDDQGGVVKWFGTCIDIDDMKVAQSALRESEERFQAMANGIPQLSWMAEADGNIFWYNQRWYDYTGTTFERMQGWGWQSVHDPTVLPKVMEGWQAAIAAGTPFEMEFPLRRADGRFGSFLTRVRPLRDAEGRVLRWFGTNTDISDLKLAERRLEGQAEELSRQAIELARSRQALEIQTLMLQSVLDSMQEGLVAADETGRFILWNPAATRIVGMGAEDVPPAEWHRHYGVYMPDAVTAFPIEQNPLTRALLGEVSTAEMFVRNPALEHGVWIEISGSPLKSADGSLRGGVVAFRDISQRKIDEREIHELNEQLEERVAQRTAELATANHELEAFAYSVSHDLRAPLRHIGGFSKILIEDFGPTLAPEAVRHLERIEEGTRRMGQLVDELLNLARVGRHALKLQSTPLNALIEEVISLLQPEVQGRVVTWKIAELPAAECDPILMKQVFQNLIANALKFTRPRERAVIEIGIVPEGGQAAVFVRDNGVGFNMKYSDKLFGVFQRLHRIEDFEGTGVGLATVQRIVHKHGGRVWAEAELDKGATFFFTLEPVKGARSKAEEVLRTDAKALNAEEEESKAAAAAGSGNELN